LFDGKLVIKEVHMGLTLLDESLINKSALRKTWERGIRSPDTTSQMIDLCIYDPYFVAELLHASDNRNHQQDLFIADHLTHHLAPYKKFLITQGEVMLDEIKAWKLLCQHRDLEKIADKHLARLPSKVNVWVEQIHHEERKLFMARAELIRSAG
jgi:hypothetical protein